MFKEFKLGYSYKIVQMAIEIILGNEEENYFFVTELDMDSYFNRLILENKDKILTPKKITLLHVFISDVFDAYFDNEVYLFRDNEYCDLDMYGIIQFFENTFINILEEYNKKIKDISVEIEKLDNKLEKDKITDDEYQEKLDEYIDYFYEKIDSIKDMLVDEIFYILFMNKRFIIEFNKTIAFYIRSLNKEENNDIFDAHGCVKRCSRLPEWLKRAIYFKGNGVCQKCGCDLSNAFRINKDRQLQYDHIVPLEKGGMNDPTNFQILCESCNQTKGCKIEDNKTYYQVFW